MTDRMIRAVTAGVLLLHGLGHGGALGALAWIQLSPGSDAGAWLAARSWLVPSLSGTTATTLASAIWIVSMVGFVIAAMSLYRLAFPSNVWRPLAVVSAVISIFGIVLFFGTWPMFNTIAALGVNTVVLVAVVWLRWPTEAMLGR